MIFPLKKICMFDIIVFISMPKFTFLKRLFAIFMFYFLCALFKTTLYMQKPYIMSQFIYTT